MIRRALKKRGMQVDEKAYDLAKLVPPEPGIPPDETVIGGSRKKIREGEETHLGSNLQIASTRDSGSRGAGPGHLRPDPLADGQALTRSKMSKPEKDWIHGDQPLSVLSKRKVYVPYRTVK